MTLLESAPTPTATGPTGRSVARQARGPILVVLALVITGVVVAALSVSDRGELDPGAYDPRGAHAIAALLSDRGVTVRRVETADAVQPRTGSTVFVPIATSLTAAELAQLSR